MLSHRKILDHHNYGCLWIKSFILFLQYCIFCIVSYIFVCGTPTDALYYAGLAVQLLSPSGPLRSDRRPRPATALFQISAIIEAFMLKMSSASCRLIDIVLFYLCRLAMHSRLLLFSEGFPQSIVFNVPPPSIRQSAQLASQLTFESLPHPGHCFQRKTPGRWSATKMMCDHLSLEVNPYAIRSRYWCDSLVRTKSMTQIYVMLCQQQQQQFFSQVQRLHFIGVNLNNDYGGYKADVSHRCRIHIIAAGQRPRKQPATRGLGAESTEQFEACYTDCLMQGGGALDTIL